MSPCKKGKVKRRTHEAISVMATVIHTGETDVTDQQGYRM